MSRYKYYSGEAPTCCSRSSSSSAEMNLYQAFIFSVPIFFTFVLLLLFYLFYLRRRRVDRASFRLRTSLGNINSNISRDELGLKKELREMLPIIVYEESFSIRDTQCSVCLGDYRPEERLQQIPACGHTFHMDCIDNWLANHTTCPLCRLSLLASSKASSKLPDMLVETSHLSSATEDGDGTTIEPRFQACEETQGAQLSELRNGDSRIQRNDPEGERRSCQCVDQGRQFREARNENEVV
ncbi:zf-RING_2 domain-containing protein [Cephalotus follicularis]|uniref:RING-type E3 ubiquitin transferase n=1 Tax=Cephalotus follicularis TaxID=3775 RepID=A0A1Q3BW04_CEPFO|nr:zf-RING_2 domain-containing protein [Cephalotus follicularis]